MDRIDSLLTFVNDSLDEKDRITYATSLDALKKKFENANSSTSLDNYSVECLSLFNKAEIGLPQELYKGSSLDDVNAYINDLARDFKQFMCNALKNRDVNLSSTANDTWKNSLQYLIGAIAAQAGLNNFLIVIFSCSIIQYCIANNIDNLCRDDNNMTLS